ncbi:hypothetical protein [Clavibacter sp.]|uniref:hypothetical protein n=1 Tax=Clavibacter sp. TaxID=1871044 RepID=UPI0019CC06BB|nr:hypothetical protein [Clavibacter sp.]MBD5381910.1 hypothetical protein [Clavibacter sp.]
MDELKSDIREIFAEKISEVEDDPYFVFTVWSDNDIVEEHIEWLANDLNKSMKKYLHMSDTHIAGNFKNIRYDYKGDFADMVKRLDEGAQDEQTNADRDFLLSWFWDAFGTFGISYNFATELDESIYVAEQEEMAIA